MLNQTQENVGEFLDIPQVTLFQMYLNLTGSSLWGKDLIVKKNSVFSWRVSSATLVRFNFLSWNKVHQKFIIDNLQRCVDGGSFGRLVRNTFHTSCTQMAFVLCGFWHGCSASSHLQTCASKIHIWMDVRCCASQHEPAIWQGQRTTRCNAHNGTGCPPGEGTRELSTPTSGWTVEDTDHTSINQSLCLQVDRRSAYDRLSEK